jgi:hypothetical protein
MMIGFKQEFVRTLQLMKKSKVVDRVSYVDPEAAEGVKPWPAVAEEAVNPLAGRCAVRDESFGYVLVAYDVVFIVDKLAISVLKMCNGFNSPKEIKRGVSEELGRAEDYCGDDLEIAIEQAISNLAKGGIVLWMPKTQLHLERLRERRKG